MPSHVMQLLTSIYMVIVAAQQVKYPWDYKVETVDLLELVRYVCVVKTSDIDDYVRKFSDEWAII